jgi:hypothetical protein
MCDGSKDIVLSAMRGRWHPYFFNKGIILILQRYQIHLVSANKMFKDIKNAHHQKVKKKDIVIAIKHSQHQHTNQRQHPHYKRASPKAMYLRRKQCASAVVA